MKTVIYLDELLLVNFAAAAAFLLGAGLLCGRRCAAWRLVLGSAAGALAALALLLSPLPFWAALACKAASCAGMVALAYGRCRPGQFVRLCAWVLVLALALTGAALLPGAQAVSGNLSVYVPLSPGLLLLCCGAVYALVRGLLFFFGRTEARCAELELELGAARVRVRAFCDTGFAVRDAVSGREAVLLRYEAVRGELEAGLRGYLDEYFRDGRAIPPAGLGVRLIPCGTVAGRCLLPAVPAKALVRRCGPRVRRQEGLVAAFAAGLPPGDWDMLLGSEAAAGVGI